MAGIRLNKYLSRAGVASRRQADRLISEGRVRVNGKVVRRLGAKADAGKDEITVDGKKVAPKETPVYVLMNKPPGYLVTMKDPLRRPTVFRLLPSSLGRIFPVGRLDFDSEGLLLLTNDGEMAHRLMHPRYGIKKVYKVRVRGLPGTGERRLLEKGLFLDGKKTAPTRVSVLGSNSRSAAIRIELAEGRKREVKRMFEAVGHPVLRLKRLQFGGLKVGNLKRGQWRHLRPHEISALRKKTGLS